MNTLALGSLIGPYQIVAPIAQEGVWFIMPASHCYNAMWRLKFCQLNLPKMSNFWCVLSMNHGCWHGCVTPDIVPVFDVGASGEHHYIVMEYLPGGMLASELAVLRKKMKHCPFKRQLRLPKKLRKRLNMHIRKAWCTLILNLAIFSLPMTGAMCYSILAF
ncbi:MAG: hypothetical protein KGS46_18070 [Chloroflexi bacterium]|jgi:serine/threonine protein kinase|nr:hypothetical protein [Chloroflexota bacterium]